MQVAHTTDNVTHAVIGGMGATSFGISDEPAFFQILSSALYKDPMYAMVRETICNGWDAHIDSERTDRPMTITLDGEKLVIRDYGKGIPHDLIGPIYGVYGASTKKNDGRQTGGFGLGCKSPFAYTDHFEVISHHDGKRTIYNMSKSSAEKMGKPSIVPIASFPTTETGIQVTIPLKGDSQDVRLSDIVRQVVFNGDISATFNGYQLGNLGLSKAENGFMLLNDNVATDDPTGSFQNHRIYVRYGNVVYPVEIAHEIKNLWQKISNLLIKVYKCRLVMMAPPDSISITPSRESLTMSELTVQTLTTLMGNFLAHLMQNRELSARHDEMVDEYIVNAARGDTAIHNKLTLDSWRIPGVPDSHHSKYLHTTEDFAFLEVLLKYGSQAGELKTRDWLKMINRYLGEVTQKDSVDRGLVQSWQATARKAKKYLGSPNSTRWYNRQWEVSAKTDRKWSESRAATQWWYKRVVDPLVQKLQTASPDHFNTDMLFYNSTNIRNREYHKGSVLPNRIDDVRLTSHTHNLQMFVMPTVVICHNARLAPRRMDFVLSGNFMGTARMGSYFIIEVNRLKGVAEELITALQGISGVEVFDMTGRLSHEQDAYENRLVVEKHKRAARKKALDEGKVVIIKKVRPGLVRLDQLISKDEHRVDTLFLERMADPERLREPSFIAKISQAKDKQDLIDDFNRETSFAIAKLWGSEGVITVNSGVYQRQKEKGTMELSAFVVDKVVKDLAVNQELKAHMAFDADKAEAYLDSKTGYHAARNLIKLYRMILTVPGMESNLLGYTPLSEDNQLRLVVWNSIANRYPWEREDNVKAATEDIKSVKLGPEAIEFLDKLIKNEFLGLLDMGLLQAKFVSERANPLVMDKLKSIVNLTIN